mmetsp:Transcript_100718/g.252522  ORF Transcript_100718/g.252522 Transcript_100718/m.252522 type:complete len:201 (+) Transcript_100718:315-917(+)
MHDPGGMHWRLHLDAAADLILARGPDVLDVEVYTHAQDLVPLRPDLHDLRHLALVLALHDLHRVTRHDVHGPLDGLVGPVVHADACLAALEPEPLCHLAASIRLRPRRCRKGVPRVEGHARLGPVCCLRRGESVHKGGRCCPVGCQAQDAGEAEQQGGGVAAAVGGRRPRKYNRCARAGHRARRTPRGGRPQKQMPRAEC